MHTTSQLCATVPIDHWGYPLSIYLMPCAGGSCPCSHGTCNCSQHFDWQPDTGMIRMSAHTEKPGWCLGVRTTVTGPLEPTQHPPIDKSQTPCHLSMITSCNRLRFRPSIPVCNACLSAHQANPSAVGCDKPDNKRDVKTFCGREPIQPPAPEQKWDLRFQAMIVISTEYTCPAYTVHC